MKKLYNIVIIVLTLLIAIGSTLLIIDTSQHKQTIKRTKRTSGAMEALQLWSDARAYPNLDIPPDKYYREYVNSKKNLKEIHHQVQSFTQWKSIGPHNIGGRTNAIAINPLNPRTIYAGSASGGLWRSYTEGIGADAWDQVSTGYPVLGVMAILIHPTDTNTIYIGTGEVYRYQGSFGSLAVRTTRGSYGIGILKTTNNGVTWTKCLDWSYQQQRGVQALRFNPHNPNTIFAATTEGIYRSYNGGASWNLILDVPMGQDIVINSNDTNLVIVSCGNLGSIGSGLYRSTNSGDNWTRISSIPEFSGKTLLSMHQANPNIVYASVADSMAGLGIWRSSNFGVNWTLVNSTDIPQYQGWFSHFVAVHPTEPDIVFAGGIDIWRSLDGGLNFTQKSYWYLWYMEDTPPGGPEGPYDYAHADHHGYAFHPTNPDIIYFATDGGIFVSMDLGETFEGRNGGYQTSQFYNGVSCSYSDSILTIGGMQDNATAFYKGNVAWYRVIGGDGCWTAINTINDNIIYASTQYNNIRKSTNRGLSFVTATSGLGGNASFVAPYVLAPSHPNILYTGRDIIYKSTNNASSWFATGGVLDGNPALSMAISHTSPDTVYVGMAPVFSRAKLFRTTNGGTSWTNITGTLPDRYPLDIAVDPQKSSTVYAVFGGFGTGHVFKSTNAGGSWIDITGTLPDVPTSAIVVDPIRSNYIYVGNDLGVYASTNGGTSWFAFRYGMPEASIVMDLTISRVNRMLRAATHGNGVFERELLDVPFVVLLAPKGGENWKINTTQIIKWNHFLVDSVKLEYSTDGGTNWLLISGNQPAENEVYEWLIPPTPTTKGLVRITSLNDTLIKNQSENYFTIYYPTVQMFVEKGWNLVSVPMNVPDWSVTEIFPFAQPYAYSYVKGSYKIDTQLTSGTGYWIKVLNEGSYHISGIEITTKTIDLVEGWNLIGSISSSVAVSNISTNPPNIISSRFFCYHKGYYIVDLIRPGFGYWVKSNSAGQLNLSESSSLGKVSNSFEQVIKDFNSLSFHDKLGNKQTLYFSSRVLQETESEFELPPIANREIFDIRFAKDKMLKVFDFEKNQSSRILLQGFHPPLEVKWKIQNDEQYELIGINEKSSILQSGGSIKIIWDSIKELTLILKKPGSLSKPNAFALYQNYPNPFNPVTIVNYQLPIDNYVNITVYNALGQEVAVLVNEVQEAGNKSIEWNASGFPSGVYYLRMIATDLSGEIRFHSIRKLMVMK